MTVRGQLRITDHPLIGLIFALTLSAILPLRTSIAQTPDRSADVQARLDALKAKIEQVKYEKMKTALTMDDATAQKFFTIYKPAEQEVQQIVKERNDEVRKLSATMAEDPKADVDPELQTIRDLNRKIEDRAQQLDNDLKPILSSQQRAKLLVFEREFNKRVQLEVAKRKLLKANPDDRSSAQVQGLRKKLRKARIQQWLLKHPNALKNVR